VTSKHPASPQLTARTTCARPVLATSSDQLKPEPTGQNVILKTILGEAPQTLPQFSGVDGGHALEISKYPLLGLEELWWEHQPQHHQEDACWGSTGKGEAHG